LENHMLVVKLGGSAGIDTHHTLDDLAELWPDQRIVLVHGANAALDAFQRRLGKEPRLVRSSRGEVSRFTDRETMDDFLAIYAGTTNKRIVESLQARGVNAVGLTGLDGRIARGTRKEALRIVEDGKARVLRGDYAGTITDINVKLLGVLLENGYMPVLTPPALATTGVAINVDGDKLALQLALALRAEALVLLSNTAGLLANRDDPDSRLAEIDVRSEASIDAALGAADGRMIKKVRSAIDAVQTGIPLVVLADARVENPVRRALTGDGTMVRQLNPQAIGRLS
jgi:acetylglutamate/LysW-gamma-L-alpha-aminoadipate kinase